MAACGPCGASRMSTVTYRQNAGPLELAGFPDCTERYSGPAMVVTVVDRLGPNERLYNGKDLGDAAIYSMAHNGASLETINAFQLCAAAIAYYGLTPP